MSLIVNEKRLPTTIKRLFKNSVSEIVGELLQNSQRGNASEIHFYLNQEPNTIIVRDNGSGVPPDKNAWAQILRMADSFYQNATVEANQKPMGVGLLSLFALGSVRSVTINSRGKRATIETEKLWESENYWARWTDLIEDAPDSVEGFELIVRYDEPETTYSYNRLAHKFEYALTQHGDGGGFAAPRGYQNFLKVFLDGKAVDTSLPRECVPSGENLIYDDFYENNRLRIGQSLRFYNTYAYVVWYGQIIKLDSKIPFLLEVAGGDPVTPLAPTRNSLVGDEKLEKLRQFVEGAVFARLGDETIARKMKVEFIKTLFHAFPARAKNELPVCVARVIHLPPDKAIESYADFCDLGEDAVLTYREIENQKIEIFESAVSFLSNERRNLSN